MGRKWGMPRFLWNSFWVLLLSRSEKSRDAEVSQDQYKDRKKTLCSTEIVCYTRSLILIFSWGFSECPVLPFWRGYRMLRFPKTLCVLAKLSYPPKGKFSHPHPFSSLPLFLPQFPAARPLFLPRFSFLFLAFPWHWAALQDIARSLKDMARSPFSLSSFLLFPLNLKLLFLSLLLSSFQGKYDEDYW